MKPAQLESRPFGRVVRDPALMPDGFETFTLEVQDPTHARALILRLAVTGAHPRAVGQLFVAFIDREKNRTWTHEESFLPPAFAIDPERFGLGLGETLMGEGQTRGIARAGDEILTFDLQHQNSCPATGLLPGPWFYSSPWVSYKSVLVDPSARVASGRVELWHGSGRHVDKTLWDVTGATAITSHQWGTRFAGPFTSVRCAHFEEAPIGAALELYCGPLAVMGCRLPAQLAWLRLDGDLYTFNGCRQLFAGEARTTQTSCNATLTGPDGTLVIRAVAAPTDTLVCPAVGPVPRSNCHYFATLELELTPKDGPKRTLTSRRAILQTH